MQAASKFLVGLSEAVANGQYDTAKPEQKSTSSGDKPVRFGLHLCISSFSRVMFALSSVSPPPQAVTRQKSKPKAAAPKAKSGTSGFLSRLTGRG